MIWGHKVDKNSINLAGIKIGNNGAVWGGMLSASLSDSSFASSPIQVIYPLP